jgi:hypothetical protein
MCDEAHLIERKSGASIVFHSSMFGKGAPKVVRPETKANAFQRVVDGFIAHVAVRP